MKYSNISSNRNTYVSFILYIRYYVKILLRASGLLYETAKCFELFINSFIRLLISHKLWSGASYRRPMPDITNFDCCCSLQKKRNQNHSWIFN